MHKSWAPGSPQKLHFYSGALVFSAKLLQFVSPYIQKCVSCVTAGLRHEVAENYVLDYWAVSSPLPNDPEKCSSKKCVPVHEHRLESVKRFKGHFKNVGLQHGTASCHPSGA